MCAGPDGSGHGGRAPPRPTSILHQLDPSPSTRRALPAPGSWRRELAAAIRDTATLAEVLGLPVTDAAATDEGFPLLVPRDFVGRMRRGDPRDPLLLQVLPRAAEGVDVPGFGTDPVGELASQVSPGVLRKYSGRVLAIAAGGCAVHCRYCFRREFPYDAAPRGEGALEATLAHVAADSSVREVILSGGDPLMLGDDALLEWSRRLADVPHVRRLRVHTRLPIVLPSRVDGGLLGWLDATRATGLSPWLVVHANHPNEVAGACADALATLVQAGVPVLNQAVLLRDVNDDADALAELCERLVEVGVQPYYLHLLDPVRGAAHFDVDAERGRALVAELRRRLPGYAVPRLVREETGAAHKTPVGEKRRD